MSSNATDHGDSVGSTRCAAASFEQRDTRSAWSPDEVYLARCERFALEEAACTHQFNRLANARLVVFLAMVIAVGWGIRESWWPGLLAGVVLLSMFITLVKYHGSVGLRRLRAVHLQRINAECRNRLARAWDDLPLHGLAEAGDPAHAYATDLDLFGRASLFQLVDTTTTSMGGETLRHWLSAPASIATVRERQVAVAELAGLLELRQELQLHGRIVGDVRPDPEPFLAWAEGEPWLKAQPVLMWSTRLSPVLVCGLLVAQLLGLVATPFWLIFLVVNAALWRARGQRASAILDRVAHQEGAFRHYAESISLLTSHSFASPLLQALQSRLTVDGRSALAYMRRLEWLSQFVIPRSAQIYWVAQGLLLWDIHVLAALERWQAVVGPKARGWLAVLADVEALAALASLAHDYPTWVYPELEPATSSIDALGIGHPLLHPNARVDNDVTVGPPGTFLLVTGSNMAGKSTLLRTLGVNIVLAQAGGPVCARRLRMPPVSLWTSMRLTDSLERGVSTFLAEVLRLKLIVAEARRADEPGAPRLCFLLDEMFQGTNTIERRIAARRVLRHLVAHGAIGAISTHDLTLAEAPDLVRAAVAVHLRDVVVADPGGPRMVFDYQLRAGLATSTNALRLMELVGLPFDPT